MIDFVDFMPLDFDVEFFLLLFPLSKDLSVTDKPLALSLECTSRSSFSLDNKLDLISLNDKVSLLLHNKSP